MATNLKRHPPPQGGPPPPSPSAPSTPHAPAPTTERETYLGTTAMRATQSTMELVSSLLGFNIVELWTEGNEDGHLHCTYVYAERSVLEKYPKVIAGHFPRHVSKHQLSPHLCALAKASPGKFVWRCDQSGHVVRERNDSSGQLVMEREDASIQLGHTQSGFPAHTEMAYQLPAGEDEDVSVFIVAFATDRIDYKPQKLKFLSGLGYAIYVAAFDLDADDEEGADGAADEAAALDKKIFLPRPLSTTFVLGADAASDEALRMGVWGSQHVTELRLGGSASAAALNANADDDDDNAGPMSSSSSVDDFLNALTDSPLPKSTGSARVAFKVKDAAAAVAVAAPAGTGQESPKGDLTRLSLHRSSSGNSVTTSAVVENALRAKPAQNLVVSDLFAPPQKPDGKGTPVPMALSLPPTWDPVDEFSYPVAEIPISVLVPDNLQMEHFDDMQHIADGSNANIFLAKLNGERVVVKMIKSEVQRDPVAVHEFDVEHGMLSRISHPHVIKLMGAGRTPRRFIVLEYLGGGSLNGMLSENQSKGGFAQRLFRRPTFTYANLLSKARDMAEALDFLHRRCHLGATVIHRDLKPDNVGFTSSGILKLFDFGLCTCVRRRRLLDEAYELTGNTGSLRYMAPEVALRKPYSEKVDVYSWAIMLWQMARDSTPFKGLTRDDFMKHVVNGNERPKLDKSWPSGFSSMLTACWHRDPQVRPSFEDLVKLLDKLIHEHSTHGSLWPLGRSASKKMSTAETQSEKPVSPKPTHSKQQHSTWF